VICLEGSRSLIKRPLISMKTIQFTALTAVNFTETCIWAILSNKLICSLNRRNIDRYTAHDRQFDQEFSYKSSAVAEMGDHLTTIYMGEKEGAAVPLSG